MALSGDRLTGWPTKADPEPYKRANLFGTRLSRHPVRKNVPDDQQPVEDKGTAHNPALDERATQAEDTRARHALRRQLKEVCRIYGVDQLVNVTAPGAKDKRRFSRTCQLAKCRFVYWEDDARFIEHILSVHGSPEKDAAWREAHEQLEDPSAPDLEPESKEAE